MQDSDRIEILKAAAEKIKSFGFQVMLADRPGDCLPWGILTDGKNVGYFQVDGFGFVDINTIHRPGKEGTGFSIEGELLVKEITKEMCERSFITCPEWYLHEYKADPGAIRKYTLEEYLNQKRNYTYKEF